MPEPDLFKIPRAPGHCSPVLVWQNQVLPVWDILAGLNSGSSAQDARLVAVVGHQSYRRQAPRFGDRVLAELPVAPKRPPCRPATCLRINLPGAKSRFPAPVTRQAPQPLDLPKKISGAFAAGMATQEAPGARVEHAGRRGGNLIPTGNEVE